MEIIKLANEGIDIIDKEELVLKEWEKTKEIFGRHLEVWRKEEYRLLLLPLEDGVYKMVAYYTIGEEK